MGAIISFLGGSAFRAVWGEVSTWLNNRQAHAQEMERMKLQSQLDVAKSAQQLEAIKTQAALQIQTVQVQSQAAIDQSDAEAFKAAVAAAETKTGVAWVDAWNGSIRPAFATVALILWICALASRSFALIAWDLDLIGSVAGFFFADRSLRNRGK
jgi:hypothetical protein